MPRTVRHNQTRTSPRVPKSANDEAQTDLLQSRLYEWVTTDQSRRDDAIDEWVAAGLDLNIDDGLPLLLAVQQDDARAEQLLRAGADVRACNDAAEVCLYAFERAFPQMNVGWSDNKNIDAVVDSVGQSDKGLFLGSVASTAFLAGGVDAFDDPDNIREERLSHFPACDLSAADIGCGIFIDGSDTAGTFTADLAPRFLIGNRRDVESWVSLRHLNIKGEIAANKILGIVNLAAKLTPEVLQEALRHVPANAEPVVNLLKELIAERDLAKKSTASEAETPPVSRPRSGRQP